VPFSFIVKPQTRTGKSARATAPPGSRNSEILSKKLGSGGGGGGATGLRLGGLFAAVVALAEEASQRMPDPETTSARSGVTTAFDATSVFLVVATVALAGADFCSAFAFAFNSSSFAARSLFFTSSKSLQIADILSNSFSGQQPLRQPYFLPVYPLQGKPLPSLVLVAALADFDSFNLSADCW
jgi:hypothetical protein